MIRQLARMAASCTVVTALVAVAGLSSDAELFFSSDKTGRTRVTNVQEGSEIWIVVIDEDENLDCDVRDKFWTDVKLMDPKTGALIVWKSYLTSNGGAAGFPYDEPSYIPYQGHWPGGTAGWLGGDFFEETGPDTGVFVSRRAFQIGTRESFSASEPWKHTHVVDQPVLGETDDFRWGHYLYADFDGDGRADNRGWFGAGGSGAHPDFNLQMMLQAPLGSYRPVPPSRETIGLSEYLIGRFENMDTLVGMVQDPDDETDIAVAMMKIIDTEATISWGKDVISDSNNAATITVVDPDENLNCNEIECVPVFLLVNPGSWNPVNAEPALGDGGNSPTNFCMLKRTGGVDRSKTNDPAVVYDEPIRWYNIYNQGNGVDHRYYIQYPTELVDDDNVVLFDTTRPDGITAVLFYAWETGASTGVFQLNLNSIGEDLGFESLRPRDVVVAYYLDPNDFDDFKLATTVIEDRRHSATRFTDAMRSDVDVYWLGRDAIYVEVLDANANVDPCCPEQVVVHLCDPHGEDDSEWILLDETSSSSPTFFSTWGLELRPVWDAMHVGLPSTIALARIRPKDVAVAKSLGGFQLVLDNWRLEAFNEDDVYVRYNDVYYGASGGGVIEVKFEPDVVHVVQNNIRPGLGGLGDSNTHTSFPPFITLGGTNTTVLTEPLAVSPGVRVANDVSFDWMSIGDTQVWDGTTTNLYWLDRDGNRVSGYANTDCVFIGVVDPDQNEDPYRRERIDGFWDGGQHIPFGPKPLNEFSCDWLREETHPVNVLLGDTNIFNDSPDPNADIVPCDGEPKIYVLNPRSGRWAALDLLETGVATGTFVSVICVDLAGANTCAPSLDVVPGDTIVAFYQDPSNHSDSAMISIKVGIGGGGAPPGQASTTAFVDADGNEVASYAVSDAVYVSVVDPSRRGDSVLAGAVEIDGVFYDLAAIAAGSDTFRTGGLTLGSSAGDSLVATYTDPADPSDTSTATVLVTDSQLAVERFYATPNPFAAECTFSYVGTGIAETISVEVYDLSGHLVWSGEGANATKILWDGTSGAPCEPVANGPYLYVIAAGDGTNQYSDRGIVFVSR